MGVFFLKFIEVKGDLFSEPYRKGDIYVHCISADFALGAGIAKQFREKFPIFTQEKQRMIQEFSCVSRFGLFPVVTEGYSFKTHHKHDRLSLQSTVAWQRRILASTNGSYWRNYGTSTRARSNVSARLLLKNIKT